MKSVVPSSFLKGIIPDILEGLTEGTGLLVLAVIAGFVVLFGGAFKQRDTSFKKPDNCQD